MAMYYQGFKEHNLIITKLSFENNQVKAYAAQIAISNSLGMYSLLQVKKVYFMMRSPQNFHYFLRADPQLQKMNTERSGSIPDKSNGYSAKLGNDILL